MKYRLKSDVSVECDSEPFEEGIGCRPWVSVLTINEHLFHMPQWLFDKQWELVPETDEGKPPEDGLPAFGTGCPKCGGDAVSVRYVPEITDEQVKKAEQLYERRKDLPQNMEDLPPMACEEHLTVTCGCGHVYWTRTKDFG
jgi:hypothetical protein